MPAINVARTDTLEQQRVKINDIGSQVFSITAGGSDLSTGNLKLGDGTIIAPSLAFQNEGTLGLFRSSVQTISFVSDSKFVFDISRDNLTSFKDFKFTKNSLQNSGIIISNSGQNYDPGSYTAINLTGGSGTGAIADIVVSDYVGTSFSGRNYKQGNYVGIELSGGSGSGATLEFNVDGVTGNINNAGSGYVDNTYSNVSLTGGSGSNIIAEITINNGEVVLVDITDVGQDYLLGDVLSANTADIGGSGAGFQFTITSNPGQVVSETLSPYGTGYQVGDILTLPGAVTGVSTSLRGQVSAVSTTLSTSSAQITVASTTGIVVGMNVTPAGGDQTGTLAANTTVQSVDSATTLTLSATPTAAGAANLNFTSPGTLTEISVASTTGILDGYTVLVTSGTGVLASDTTVSFIDTNTNTITLSAEPTTAGDVTVSFVPPYGNATQSYTYTITSLGPVTAVSLTDGGNGYANSDVVSVNATDLTQPVSYSVTVAAVQEIDFTSTYPDGTFTVGQSLQKVAGGVTASQVASSTTILGQASQNYTNVASTGGSGSGATFDVTRDNDGVVSSVNINQAGSLYTIGDTLTIAGNVVGGSTPADNITVTVDDVAISSTSTIHKVFSSGGNITKLIVSYNADNWQSGEVLIVSGQSSPSYTLSTVGSSVNRYFINSGSGPVLTPDLTLYSGTSYVFDYSDASNSGHPFNLSAFPDGKWSPSLVSGVATTLDVASKQITVASTTGILAGMEVSRSSGTGAILASVLVESVDSSTTLTLAEFPTTSGPAVLDFFGTSYTDGTVLTSSSITIKISDTTPDLYYYCSFHPDMGGSDGEEGLLTTDNNNPKVFGSGLAITASNILSTDSIEFGINSGSITGSSASLSSLSSTTGAVTTLTSSSITTTGITTGTITSTSLSISSPTTTISGNVNIGSNLSVVAASGNLTTSGVLKTTSILNVSDKLLLQDSEVRSNTGYDILLRPALSRLAKTVADTAFVIPAGTTAQRPQPASSGGLAEDGAIRFNTETSQYEGYNSSTTSWSSLGGVRDIDGNTFILAELSAGANDNTLWFYNDNSNTLKLTPNELEFVSVKKISSSKLGLPTFQNWSPSVSVSIGQYLKYGNNLYEVTAAGVTGPSNSPPTHTSGVANNGTAQLTWSSLAVAPLEFSEVEEVRVGPNKDCPLVISQEIKILDNVISTLVQDLVITPNAGKKVTIDAPSSLVIPSGNTNQRGSAAQGSIRFNTTISQFEGYSGANWSSLGGVRDVDGNTYIIPETAPAANENILYFYNNNVNTLQLRQTELDFTNIDTITTSGGNSLALNTDIVTLDNSATTIDNTDASRSFISTTKQYLDLGLSSGLNVDPVLRLDDQGDVYLNTGFGTGNFSGVKIFDGDLKDFELADYAIKTKTFDLTKGSVNTNISALYGIASAKGCDVTVVCKSTSGKKSMAKYSVIDDGTDLYFTEIGSLNTSAEGFTATFDINATNEVRISLTLSDDHSNGDVVSFTLVTQTIK